MELRVSGYGGICVVLRLLAGKADSDKGRIPACDRTEFGLVNRTPPNQHRSKYRYILRKYKQQHIRYILTEFHFHPLSGT